MSVIAPSLNRVVTAIVVVLSFSATLAGGGSAAAQEAHPDRLGEDQLLERLADPDQAGWRQIEERLRLEWSKSGSPAMDLLLQRGQKAIEAEDYAAAIEHLTALTDHAPDFAEGWNLRATVHFRMERYGLALEAVRRTLTLNPNHFAAMTGLGIILESMGQDSQALVVLRRAHSINPHREDVGKMIENLERELDGSDA